ncbi:MAG: DUF4432 family protein [bacterium]|nr:DUF4432 family protein [bacterium]
MLSANSGCRWMECLWNGITTVIMENDLIRLEILADKGTDIVEFLYKPLDIDFMWRSPIPLYKPYLFITTAEGKVGNFLDWYPGGWQEIFPNGGGICEYKGAVLGLHGEVALLPWRYDIVDDSREKLSIKFYTQTYRTPFLIEKTISIEKNNPFVCFDEKITNKSGEEMDFIWGHHPAFGKPFLSPDCIIRIKKAKVFVGKGDGRSFTNLKQTEGIWPMVEGINGKKVDISICPDEKDNVSEVMFLSELSEGKYEIFNTKLKIGFQFEFPLDVFRYIWFWRIGGGSFEYPWYGRNYNIALEPFSSLPNLADAVKRGDSLKLSAGASLKASIKTGVITS